MNQPLAHPIGAGFDELVAGADLHIFGFSLTGKVNNISTAYDFDDYNLGRNILIPDNEGQKPDYIVVGTENPTTINLYTFRISYEINTRTHLKVFAEVSRRSLQNLFTYNQLFFISFGVKNYLKNFYNDL